MSAASSLDSACMAGNTVLAQTLITDHKTAICAELVCEPQSLDLGILFSCKRENTVMVRLLLDALGLLISDVTVRCCVHASATKTMGMMFMDYQDLITSGSLCWFIDACEQKDIAMINLFIDNFGHFDDHAVRDICKRAYRLSCYRGDTDVLDVLEARVLNILVGHKTKPIPIKRRRVDASPSLIKSMDGVRSLRSAGRPKVESCLMM